MARRDRAELSARGDGISVSRKLSGNMIPGDIRIEKVQQEPMRQAFPGEARRLPVVLQAEDLIATPEGTE